MIYTSSYNIYKYLFSIQLINLSNMNIITLTNNKSHIGFN